LPALLTLAGIGVTATIAWHNQAPWHTATVSAILHDGDDYVQGLAKLGIAKLPVYARPSILSRELIRLALDG
jgi:hypothetical protein